MRRYVAICALVCGWITLSSRAQLLEADPDPFAERLPEFGLSLTLEPVDAHRAVVWITFEMPDDWHTYGPFQNDTGSIAIVEFELPEGVREGARIWPLPKRHVAPGLILDYVYEGTVSVGTWLDGPEGWAREGIVSADVEWLVCNDDTCIPRFREGVRAERASDSWRPTGAFPEGLHSPEITRDLNGVSFRWDSDQLVIDAPGSGALCVLPFREGAVLERGVESGTTETGRLHLTFDRSNADIIEALVVIRKLPEAHDPPGRTDGAPEAFRFRALTGQEPTVVIEDLPPSVRGGGIEQK